MIARRLTLLCIAALLCSAAISESGPGTDRPPGTIQLHGAGATFPAPLYKKWLEEYRKRQPTVEVSYDAIGSGDGVKQFMAGQVDFGASDAAMTDAEMAEVTRGVQLVPVVAGSRVLAYNLDGLGGPLKLTREVYVDIFLGQDQGLGRPAHSAHQSGPQAATPGYRPGGATGAVARPRLHPVIAIREKWRASTSSTQAVNLRWTNPVEEGSRAI